MSYFEGTNHFSVLNGFLIFVWYSGCDWNKINDNEDLRGILDAVFHCFPTNTHQQISNICYLFKNIQNILFLILFIKRI